ncbi:MAG: ABC transporter substrate-binding protein [Vicinamibacterales bacterium]
MPVSPGHGMALRAVCLLVLTPWWATACRPAAADHGAALLRTAYTSSVDIGDLPSLMAHRALEREGFQVEETFFAQPELAVQALASGDVDLASGGVRAFWAAAARGADLVMLMEHSENGYMLAALPDIGGCRDLDGRTLALSSRGSLPDALGRVFLKRCPDARPRTIAMPHSGDRLAALEAGAAEAAVLQRADVARLMKDVPGRFHTLEAFRETFPDLDFEGVFTSRRFLEQHRPWVLAYVRERLAANRRALDTPATLEEEAVQWPAMGRLDADVVAREVAAPAWTRDGGVTRVSIAATLAFFVAAGSLPDQLDSAQLSDLSVLDEARSVLDSSSVASGTTRTQP